MKKSKRLLALALAALMALSLAGCEIDLTGGGEEVDNTRWAEASTDTVVLPEEMDSTAKFATQQIDSAMYIVFNSIYKRDTGYFSAPGGSLTFTASATAEDKKLQKFKIAVWQLVDGGTQYVDGSTVYYKTDGSYYTATIDGLDPSASYRLTISYDRTSYYIYGTVRVDGVAAMGAAPEEGDSAAASGVAA